MDTAIIDLARSGDEEAFVQIYEHFSPQLHRYVYRLLGNQELADEVTQETFLKAFQNISGISSDSNLSAWLYRIASNACCVSRMALWRAVSCSSVNCLTRFFSDPWSSSNVC